MQLEKYVTMFIACWDIVCVCFAGPVSSEKIHYCERFIELMIDLEVLFFAKDNNLIVKILIYTQNMNTCKVVIECISTVCIYRMAATELRPIHTRCFHMAMPCNLCGFAPQAVLMAYSYVPLQVSQKKEPFLSGQ